MQFIYMSLFALGIVAADQYTKWLTVANIPLFGQMDFIRRGAADLCAKYRRGIFRL